MATDQEIIDAVNVFAPQYEDSARITALMPYAKTMTSNCYGDKYANAVALRICHMIALEERNGASGGTSSGDGTSGTIVSEKEGDLSRTYGNSVGDNNKGGSWGTLPSTTYGQMLIEMSQNSFMPARNRFSSDC